MVMARTTSDNSDGIFARLSQLLYIKMYTPKLRSLQFNENLPVINSPMHLVCRYAPSLQTNLQESRNCEQSVLGWLPFHSNVPRVHVWPGNMFGETNTASSSIISATNGPRMHENAFLLVIIKIRISL